MNFQQLKGSNAIVELAFEDFCIRSKPYDFCSIKSPSVRSLQIKKYYEYLVEKTDIFYLTHDKRITFFLSITPEPSHVTVEFIFGDTYCMLENFRVFREKYWKQLDYNVPFSTEIKRQHKLKSFLKFIQKKDKDAKFSLDNGKILVLYTSDGAQK
jgi:hypothetical protein